MSGDRDEALRDVLLEEATERVYALLLQARSDADAIIRRAATAADVIRREVLKSTGVEIVLPSPKVPTARDVPLDELAGLGQRCLQLLAAVEVLAPHVDFESPRTVGAALKTNVDGPTGEAVLNCLALSGFFTPEEGALDG